MSSILVNLPKYLLVAFVLGSLLYLVAIGKIDAQTYLAVVSSVLATFGYHQATKSGAQLSGPSATSATLIAGETLKPLQPPQV